MSNNPIPFFQEKWKNAAIKELQNDMNGITYSIKLNTGTHNLTIPTFM